MTLLARILFILLSGTIPGHGAGLPDTGQAICYNDSVADGVLPTDPVSIARDAGTHPRQDCRYGNDAAAIAGQLIKIGAGVNGFDYTKIANNGTALPAGTALGTANTAWACTRDNSTGLTWEVKSPTNTDLRWSGHTYTWYNSDGATNGGSPGNLGSNTCGTALSQCNTEAFVAAVNAAQLCNAFDWRMPTRRELLTLINSGAANPAIAPAYFPNTVASMYWSGSAYAGFPSYAWTVDFIAGLSFSAGSGDPRFVRLVRGAPF